MIRIVEARTRALEREQNGRTWLAWHIAAFGRVKTMPQLDQLLKKRAPSSAQAQPWQHQLAIAMRWDAAINRQVQRRPS